MGAIMSLTDKKIENIKALGKLQKILDGDGLYLFVTPEPYGTKTFYYRYKNYAGKDKSYKIGIYPTISLKNARVQHKLLSVDVMNGVCPQEEKLLKKAKKLDYRAETFDYVATKWLEWRKTKVKSDTYQKEWSRIERFLFPKFKNFKCEDITSRDLVETLTKVAKSKEIGRDGRKIGGIETSHRTMRHTSSILKYALNMGYMDKRLQNAADRQVEYLPKLPPKHLRHRSAITNKQELGRFMYKVENDERKYELVGCAMRLVPHIFVRPKEMLKLMEWKDINFSKKEWTYVVSKTEDYAVAEFTVYLTEQAITILKDIQKHTGNENKVFYSLSAGTGYISNNSLLKRLRDIGFKKDEASIAGFRATAMTLGREELGTEKHIIDLCLAHNVKDSNGTAYDRADFKKERREFMQEWSDFLIECKREFQRSLIKSV